MKSRYAQCFAHAVLLFAVLATAPARLHETLSEADRRYGRPFKRTITAQGLERRHYRKSGIYVAAAFMAGRCVHISYGDIPNRETAAALANVNTDGAEWRVDATLKSSVISSAWKDGRQVADAVLNTGKPLFLTVFAPGFVDASTTLEANERLRRAKDRTSGF